MDLEFEKKPEKYPKIRIVTDNIDFQMEICEDLDFEIVELAINRIKKFDFPQPKKT